MPKMGSLGNCEMCKRSEAKYTCPGCALNSCSLKCVNQHKTEKDCDGINIKTVYVPLGKLEQADLQNDCNLFNEIHHFLSQRRYNLRGSGGSRVLDQLPHHLNLMQRAVVQRGSRIQFLPRNFFKHRTNSTYFNWRTQQIDWRIEINFLNAQNWKVYEEKCPEETILSSLLEKYLAPQSEISKLKAYKRVGLNGIDVLLKAEKLKNSSNKFHVLDMNASLKTNLIGKTIIEYPQLYVLIKGFYNSVDEPIPPPRAHPLKRGGNELQGPPKKLRKKRQTGEKSLLFSNLKAKKEGYQSSSSSSSEYDL